jgi:type IV secretion system protein VirB10
MSDPHASVPDTGELDAASAARPQVGYRDTPWALIAGIGGALVLGGAVFAGLDANRRAAMAPAPSMRDLPPDALGAPIPEAPDLFAQQAPPPQLLVPPAPPAEPQSPPFWQMAPPPPPPPPPPAVREPEPLPERREGPAELFSLSPPPPAVFPPPTDQPERPPGEVVQRLRSPALVVDTSAPAPAGDPSAAGMAAPGDGAIPPVSADGSPFRAPQGETAGVRAARIGAPGQTVPQGALISAVLETAINSDLPGFVRAVVSRDVRSFDGTSVLVPRGSRLIGQYRSEVAIGQSRAFVVWTRLIRPDGVTVALNSPGTDPLGRSGLTGDVDRHFLQRFGPTLLTTVFSAALSRSARNNQVIIGATQSIPGASVQGEAINPTVNVPQGTAIQVFVARDLDFGTLAAPAPGQQP